VQSFGAVLPKQRVADAAAMTGALWRGLDLEPRPYGGCYDHLYLDIYPPSMQPPGDLSHLGRIEHLRPVSLGSASDDALTASIATALSGDRSVVYVTFGTVFNVTPTFSAAVEALGRCPDLVAIVTVGPNGEADGFGSPPKHVHIEHYIPAERAATAGARPSCPTPGRKLCSGRSRTGSRSSASHRPPTSS